MNAPAAPQLTAIEPRRLYRQIAEVLLGHIEKGVFPPGSFLPPERELASQLGVSRTSVREALIALEIQGRVSVRVGSGVTVLAPPVHAPATGPVPEEWPDVGPVDVVDARLLIEAETAARAARRVGARELAEMESILDRIDTAHQRGGNTVDLDRDFHLKIAEIAGNPALAGVLRRLWDYRKSALFARFEGHFVTLSLYEESAADHRHILAALAKRSAPLARAAMRKHLTRVRRAYLKSL